MTSNGWYERLYSGSIFGFQEGFEIVRRCGALFAVRRMKGLGENLGHQQKQIFKSACRALMYLVGSRKSRE